MTLIKQERYRAELISAVARGAAVLHSMEASVISVHGDHELLESLARWLTRVTDQLRDTRFAQALDDDGAIEKTLRETARTLERLKQSTSQLRVVATGHSAEKRSHAVAEDYALLEQSAIDYLDAIAQLLSLIQKPQPSRTVLQ